MGGGGKSVMREAWTRRPMSWFWRTTSMQLRVSDGVGGGWEGWILCAVEKVGNMRSNER